MTVFVDTSALFAVLDQGDQAHSSAGAVWAKLLAGRALLVTTNYVLLETAALVQHRLGVAALRTLHETITPLLEIEWIDQGRHKAAMQMTLAGRRRKLSVVDCSSFIVMREIGIQEAFAFDKHFSGQGFRLNATPES